MIRLAGRLLLGLALAAALTLVSGVGPAPAHAATAPDCTTEQAAHDAAVAHQQAADAHLQTAKQKLDTARAKLRAAAGTHHPVKVHRLRAKIKKLQQRVTTYTHQSQAAGVRADETNQDLVACQGTGGGGTGGGTGSPVQALCDAGAPQAVCDALAGLAGGGALPTDLSLQALCDAVPQTQPLCDAAGSGGGLPTDPTDLTSLLGPVLGSLDLGGLLGGGLPLP